MPPTPTNNSTAWDGLEPGRATTLRAHFPPAPLSRFVHLFWFYEGTCAAVGKERVLPLGAMQLLVRLGDDHGQTPMSILTGIQSQAMVIDKVGRDRLFGIMFRAGGTFPFLPIPGSELRDQNAPLDAIWGRTIDELRETLEATPTVEGKFRVAADWLGKIMCRPMRLSAAVHRALDLFNDVAAAPRITEMAELVGLSKRRFIEIFGDQVGVTPKQFARLQRFQAALKCIPRDHAADWVDLALSHGYYDQAHFVNEFRTLSGMTPTAYQASRGEHLNHVPLD